MRGHMANYLGRLLLKTRMVRLSRSTRFQSKNQAMLQAHLPVLF